MASTSISYDDGKPLRVTGYSAIPISNAPSHDMHMINEDRQGFLRRIAPRRTVLVAALLLTISCGLIGHFCVKLGVKRSYNSAIRRFTHLTDTSSVIENVPINYQNMRTNTNPTSFGPASMMTEGKYITGPSKMERPGMFQNPPVIANPSNFGQVSRAEHGEYLTKPSNVKNLHRSDGTRMVVSMFSVPAEPIRQGTLIKAVGVCSGANPVTSCLCTAAAPACLAARTGKVDKSLNRCLCEYTGISSDCGSVKPSVLAIASCAQG